MSYFWVVAYSLYKSLNERPIRKRTRHRNVIDIGADDVEDNVENTAIALNELPKGHNTNSS